MDDSTLSEERAREERPRVTVVVATRNRAGLLSRCLAALARQVHAPDAVVVVDDASVDGTPDVLLGASETLPLRAVRLTRRLGPAGARNRGLGNVRTPLVAFTDDDCEPEPGWVWGLVDTMAKSPDCVGGAGGRVLPAAKGLVADYMTLYRILEPPDSLGYLVTANCIYRTDAVAEVGGFDERVTEPGGEDPGLSFALRRRGWTFAFAGDAVVRHHYRESLLSFARTFYRYGRGCRVVLGA